jgi:hypothetical protein
MDHRARSWLAAACLAVGVGGCADQEELLIVDRSPAWEQGQCSADPNANEILLSGVLDLAHDYTAAYVVPVVLVNNLRPRSTKTSSGVDDSEIQLRSVDVVLSMDQAPEVLSRVAAEDPSFVSFSATLASQSLSGGEEAGQLVEAISNSAALAFRDAIEELLPEGNRPTVVATLTFHATRSGNARGSLGIVDAREYTFPIRLCVGCLGTSCETCPEESCPSEPVFGGICGNAQDGLLGPVQCDPIE